MSVVNSSTTHPALRSGGCRRALPQGAQIHRQDKRIFSGAIRILPSKHLDAIIASTQVPTSGTSGHQDKRKVAGTLGIHRGLTAHEEPAPLAEVFADDE